MHLRQAVTCHKKNQNLVNWEAFGKSICSTCSPDIEGKTPTEAPILPIFGF
jgi:hypothetical protein